jgi:hypothetical protein
MNRILFILILAAVSVSCKSKHLLASTGANETISAQKIIDNHYSNKFDFSTLYIKANAKYRDENQSQGVTAEIKIKKNEKILVSVRFLGITMAKALITPESVQYYEKINGSYFEGDYGTLSKWLGSDLDFDKVQNMLLGKALDNLNRSNYKASISEKLYKLVDTKETTTKKEYFFESEQFLVKKQEITQPQQSRRLMIAYPEYQKLEDLFFPLELNIQANHEDKSTTIDVDYKSISVNEEFTFPYSVPSGYERIYIK